LFYAQPEREHLAVSLVRIADGAAMVAIRTREYIMAAQSLGAGRLTTALAVVLALYVSGALVGCRNRTAGMSGEQKRQYTMWRGWLEALDDPSHQGHSRAPYMLSGPHLSLVEDRSEAVRPLLRHVRDRRGQVDLAVVAALGRLGDLRAEGTLTEILRADREYRARAAAAAALGKLGATKAAPALTEALLDDEASVVAAAAKAIERTGGGPLAAERLIGLLSRGDTDVRTSAAYGLGTVGLHDLRCVPLLAEAAAGTTSPFQIAAVQSLGKIGDPRGVPAVVTALDHRNPELRSTAVAACAVMGANVVGRPRGELVLALMGRLREQPPKTVTAHVLALGAVRGREVEEALLGALADPAAPVRLAGLIAIGYRGADVIPRTTRPAFVAAVTRRLGDDGTDVRVAAARVLGDFTDIEAVKPLIAALRDMSAPSVRAAVATALGTVRYPCRMRSIRLGGGSEAVRQSRQALIAALDDPAAQVRRTAVWSLGRIGGSDAAEAMTKRLNDEDPAVRLMIVRGVGQEGAMGGAWVRLLLAAAERDDPQLRREALFVLGRGGVVGPLWQIAEDRAKAEPIRADAVDALGTHARTRPGGPRNLPANFRDRMERLWRDITNPPAVRRAAAAYVCGVDRYFLAKGGARVESR